MANQIFLGNSAANAEVQTLTVGGTPQLPAPATPALATATTGGTIGSTISAPSAPTLTPITGTSNAAAVFVVVTLVNPAGETTKSAQSTATPTGIQQEQVTSPPATANATGYNIYSGTGSGGPYYLQNTSAPIAIGTPYTIPGTPAGSGTQPPVSNSAWLPYSVEITYVNYVGETTASASAAITPTTTTSTITITSPAASGTGTGAASGWYAYVTQADGATYYRQQTAGSPTAIATNLTLTANPTITGANPPGSNTAAGMVYSVAMGYGSTKIISYASGSSDTNTTVATALQALLAASLYPEFLEETWANPNAGVITATANTAGVPFTLTAAGTGTGTLTASIIIANSGPNDVSIASNWSTGSLPITGDSIYFQVSNTPALYNLQALAAITPALVQSDASFLAAIGLPVNNPNGYREYRQRYLQFTGATNVVIGQGQGQGSGKIQLDFQSTDFTMELWKAASSTEAGMPAVQVKGGNSATSIYAMKGTLGLALLAGETADVPTLDMAFVSNQAGDAQVWAGPGCTLSTVTMSGGQLVAQCAVPTLDSYGGSAQVLAGNMTTANLYNAGAQAPPSTLEYSTAGTITTNVVQKGCLLDCSGTLQGVTLTNSTWYAGATINAPAGNVTMTNAASIPDGQASDVTANLGSGRHVKVS